jgi:hypothetical protein
VNGLVGVCRECEKGPDRKIEPGSLGTQGPIPTDTALADSLARLASGDPALAKKKTSALVAVVKL